MLSEKRSVESCKETEKEKQEEEDVAVNGQTSSSFLLSLALPEIRDDSHPPGSTPALMLKQ